MKKTILALIGLLLVAHNVCGLGCDGTKSYYSTCQGLGGTCSEYYTTVNGVDYPCTGGQSCTTSNTPCSTITYTTVTYDTGTLPSMNGGTTPGINEPGFGGGAGTIFGIQIQSFILICCFLIMLIIMCTIKPPYFGILMSVLVGDFIIHIMQLMTIPLSLYLLINVLAIVNFVRGVRS